jgi:phosphopantothenoylcysteine synthetase/decarboxylase
VVVQKISITKKKFPELHNISSWTPQATLPANYLSDNFRQISGSQMAKTAKLKSLLNKEQGKDKDFFRKQKQKQHEKQVRKRKGKLVEGQLEEQAEAGEEDVEVEQGEDLQGGNEDLVAGLRKILSGADIDDDEDDEQDGDDDDDDDEWEDEQEDDEISEEGENMVWATVKIFLSLAGELINHSLTLKP